ncbi:hypothetical protein [Laspinema olomoucense]|nr:MULTISPECIES: hypothetical protein [unclassified Laspinema]MCT7975872.1 hypothetical protein [Laspinema sp. D3d]MCT7991812.1 hypothetical protein [Laspinema sp. D3a]
MTDSIVWAQRQGYPVIELTDKPIVDVLPLENGSDLVEGIPRSSDRPE